MLALALSMAPGCQDRGPDAIAGGCIFSGITVTDASGNVISEDPGDWCPSESTAFLYPALPNPTNGSISFSFGLASAGHVRMEILSRGCIHKRTLADRDFVAGLHVLSWDFTDDQGQPLSPGIYRCVFQAAGIECHGDVQLE